MDYAALGDELTWLKANPYFDERPATIREFMGPHYLNIESRIRPAVMETLVTMFGDEVDSKQMARYARGMITGAIGIGKTTIASVVLPYLAHWVLCLKDPQGFFNLLPGSRIAFMQMSTSGAQAKEVVFGDIKARIQYSPWFQENYPYDPSFKNQLRFPQKDIWILPGDSSETTFEGYNILGGILDEADSHKVTDNKDYAEQGYTTIHSRVQSRFGTVKHPDGSTNSYGFLMVVGQMKKGNGFAAKKFKEFKADPNAYAVRMTIWESFGWQEYLKPDGTRDSFWYDIKRKEIMPEGAARLLGDSPDERIEVPNVYKQDFLNNPEKALRDLAGIPPLTGSPFISMAHKIDEARDRWLAKYPGFETPVDARGRIAKWFRAQDSLRRTMHLDIAYSAEGDSLGIAMGHVPGTVEIDKEVKPFIVIDFLMRLHAAAGHEIQLADVRRVIYHLRDELKFNIKMVTLDGFQGVDTRQQLQRKRINSDVLSVDKSLTPYYDLREAIYEDRIAFPKYLVKVRPDDVEYTEILVKELGELVDNGDKIDHPDGGSKDVADAVAGVTYVLMGDRSYSRTSADIGIPGQIEDHSDNGASQRPFHPAVTGLGLRAPLPPSGDVVWRPPSRR